MKLATHAIEDPEKRPVAVTPSAIAPPADIESRRWTEHLQSLACTIVIAIFVIIFMVQAFQIPSGSMENTLLVGDYLLVDKFAYAPGRDWSWLIPYGKPRRGDIIVFKWPVHPEQHFVKRVIGVPGDRIRLIDARVFVNGEPLTENYVVHKIGNHDAFRDEFPTRRGGGPNVTWAEDIAGFTRNNELLVPQDSYFVLGDNRDDSLDSRYWGFVPRENIVGKPLVIYFSMRRFDDALFPGVDDKIGPFAGRLRELPTMARWDRMFHFVK